MTAKDIADKYAHGKMPLPVVHQMYKLRDSEVAGLRAKGVVTLSDVRRFERTGRARVADEFFTKCDDDARKALLSDEHHFVRSSAETSYLMLNRG